MKCINMVGKDFETLTRRIVYSYQCTYPGFIPTDSSSVDVNSQKEMHQFFGELISYIYDNPTFLTPKPEPDDYFDNGVMNKTKPKLVIKMKSIEKKLVEFYRLLYSLGDLADLSDNQFCIKKEQLKISNNSLKQLVAVGITIEDKGECIVFTSTKYPNCFPAWKLLTQICNPEHSSVSPELLWFMFMHCIYDRKQINISRIYGDLFHDTSCLEDMEKFLSHLGYEYTFKDNRLRLIKEYPGKQTGYLSIEFAWRRRYQMNIEFHVPKFTSLLNDYDKMDEKLQEFIFQRLKTCDNCGYCTQTDKSGKRQPLHLELTCGTETLLKCPLYPGFNWGELMTDVVVMMKQLFSLVEDMV